MAEMSHSSDHDPITKSRYEADRFNVAWLKNGEKLNWFQRIGFAGFSLAFLYCGVDSGMCAFDAFREGAVLGAFGWSITCLFFLVPGGLGLRNCLRF